MVIPAKLFRIIIFYRIIQIPKKAHNPDPSRLIQGRFLPINTQPPAKH